MRNILLLFSCLLLFYFNSFPQKNKYTSLKQMEWLTGNWQGLYNNAPFYEAWIKVHDSLMINLSIEIKDKDTLVKEHGFIRLQNGDISHGGIDATWQLTKLNDTLMVFENDTLKFANRIAWSHSSGDHWLTEIQNPRGVIHYNLIRVPWLNEVVNNFINRAKKTQGN